MSIRENVSFKDIRLTRKNVTDLDEQRAIIGFVKRAKRFNVGDLVEYEGGVWRITRDTEERTRIEHFKQYGKHEELSVYGDDLTLVDAPENCLEQYKLIGLDTDDPRGMAIAEKMDGDEKPAQIHSEVRKMGNRWAYEESGFEENDIVEYEGKNRLQAIGGHDSSIRIKGVDGYFSDTKEVQPEDLKLVSKHPEDPSDLARLIGFDEDLVGVKVVFHGCRGEEDEYYDDIGWEGEREEREESDDEAGDIWSAGWDWNMYARNYRFGKTSEMLSSVSFTKGGSKVEVEPTDLFSEYNWDTIVEGYKEAVEVGESWISV